MKKYIVINPLTNKPTQFSFFKREDIKFGETYTDSGQTYVRFHEPIYLEVNEINDELLQGTYNPKTKKLEGV